MEHLMVGLLVGAIVFYGLFLIAFPTRVAGWGAVVVRDPIWRPAYRPEALEMSGLCAELRISEAGHRALPLAPNILATQTDIIRFEREAGNCEQREGVIARFEATRFRLDAALSIATSLAFPALVLACIAARRRPALWLAGALSFAPLTYDVLSSSVWTNSAYLFPGQHVFVAKNLAASGVYGWTASEITSYGLPAEAAKAWGAGDTPLASGWTYPGYTLVLAAIYRVIMLFTHPDVATLTLIAIGANIFMVVGTLTLIGRAAAQIVGSSLVAFALLYLINLSGWSWSLCPFPVSEPLQALLLATSVALVTLSLNRSISLKATMLGLALCAGLGQITKPILGLLPSLVLMLLPIQRRRAEIMASFRTAPRSTVPIILMATLFVLGPTLILGLRNYLTFGEFIFGSTVGGLFLAQALDLGLTMPTYVGTSELTYSAGASADIAAKINTIFENFRYRDDLVQQKIALLVPAITGINYVTEAGRMGNDGYSGIGLYLVVVTAGWSLAAIYRDPFSLGLERLSAIVILGTTAVLAVTQPLGRYFVPMAFLYPLMTACFLRQVAEASAEERFQILVSTVGTGSALTVGFLALHWHHGWIAL
jgi:hypothetical protein